MLSEMFPWVSKRPKIIPLVLALALFGLGQLFRTYGVLGPLGDFTDYLERSLRSFDAMNVAGIFYRELTGCELVSDGIACAPGPAEYDRLENTLQGVSEPGLLATIIFAVINTVTAVFAQSTWLGILIWIVFLGVAGALLFTALDLDQTGAWGIVLIVILAPALARVMALGVKWLLLLFVLVFSQALAGIVFVLTAFSSFIWWVQAANTVLSDAHHIDTLASPASPNPPPDPPNA